MSERIEKAVRHFQKWSHTRFHWIILAVVALNIPDVLHGSEHQEPIRYWLAWFVIVSGVVAAISAFLHKRKLDKAQAELKPDKSDDAP